jgi:hypothetical protein
VYGTATGRGVLCCVSFVQRLCIVHARLCVRLPAAHHHQITISSHCINAIGQQLLGLDRDSACVCFAQLLVISAHQLCSDQICQDWCGSCMCACKCLLQRVTDQVHHHHATCYRSSFDGQLFASQLLGQLSLCLFVQRPHGIAYVQ